MSMRNIVTGHIFRILHRHRVLHQRYPAKVPQYVAQSLAKAALASSIASVAANNILIVSSYGSGSGLDAVGLIIYVTRIRLQANLEHGLGFPRPAPPARHYAKAPAAPQPSPPVAPAPPSRTPKHLTPPAAAPAAPPAPRIHWAAAK